MTTRTGIVGVVHGSRSESFKRLNQHHLVAGEVLLKSPISSQKQACGGYGTTDNPMTIREVLPQASGYELPKSPYAAAEKKRIRQSAAKLNKTEQAFFDMMLEHYGNSIRWQPLTLRLANGVRYTPDAVLFAGRGEYGKLFAYEVKGFMRDDAAVKLKVAAHAFPEIAFYLVTKKKGGGGMGTFDWNIQEILP